MLIDLFNQSLGTTYLAIVVVSLLCALIGPLVSYNNLNYFSSSFAHASLGGIGLAVYLGVSIVWPAQVFALVLGLLLSRFFYQDRVRFSSYLDIVYVFGMALGMLFIGLSKNANRDFSSFLFGAIALLTEQDIAFAAITGLVCLIYVVINYQKLVLISFDPEFARLKNINIKIQTLVLLAVLAVVLPLIVRIIGMTTTIALLTAAPLIVESRIDSLFKIIIACFFINLLIGFSGLLISYATDQPLGVIISLVAIGFFAINLVLQKINISYRLLRN